MQTVRVGTLEIGKGRPCVIAPLTSPHREGLLREASHLVTLPVNLAEWRVDMLDGAIKKDGTPDTEKILETLTALRKACPLPLLVTFRTTDEGGRQPVSESGYAALCESVSKSGCADLLDVEAFYRGGTSREIIARAHSHGVPVVGSYHNFYATPTVEELIHRLSIMQDDLDADILKIAVMPRHPLDVLTLLEATRRMADISRRPIISMSMGSLGVISRLAGQIFGSAATFGSAARASAPGQLDVRELDTVLGILDRIVN